MSSHFHGDGYDRIRRIHGKVLHSLRHQLAKPIALASASSLLASVTGLATMLLMAHTIGAEAFGVYGTVVSSAALATRFLSPSSAYWLPKLLADAMERRAGLGLVLNAVILVESAAVVLAVTVACIALAVLANAVTQTISMSTVAWLVAATSMGLLPSQAIVMRVLKRDMSLAVRVLVVACGRLLVMVVCASLHTPPSQTLTLLSCFDVVAFAGLLLLTRRAVITHDRTLAKAQSASPRSVIVAIHCLRQQTLLSWVNSVFKGVHRDLDILIVSGLGGLEAAGTVRMSKALVTAAMRVTDPLYNVLTAHYATGSGAHRDSARADSALHTAANILPWAMAAALLITPLGAFVVASTLNVQMAGLLPLVATFALGAAVACATVSWQPLLLARRGVSCVVRTTAAAACVQVAFLVLLMPAIGVVGSGLAYLVFYVTWGIGTRAHLQRMRQAPQGA